jgi:hypothetical protein
MPGTQGVRGKVNVVLNRLVSEGAITGFRTNYYTRDEASAPVMTVTAPGGGSLDEVRVRVMDALMDVAIGINVTVEAA